LANTTSYDLSTSSTINVFNWIETNWDPSIHITAYNKAQIINKFSQLNSDAGKPGRNFNVRSLANFADQTATVNNNHNLAGLTNAGTAEAVVSGTAETRYVFISVKEQTLAQLIVDPMQPFRNGAESALMEGIDEVGAGLFDNLSNTIGSPAANIDASLLLEGITTLASNAKQYWQPGTSKTAYLCSHHNQINDILDDPKFVQADFRGDSANAMVNGWVHKAYGVTVTTSGNIQSSSSAYHNALFIPEAFGIGWNQRMKVQKDRDGLEISIIPWADYVIMEKQDYLAVDIQTTTA